MRVVDVESLAIVEIDEAVTPYAILSHRWEEGQEIVLGDLQPPIQASVTQKNGYQKVKKACDYTRRYSEEHGLGDLRYIWIDTCCIDKTSSAELSEAINSMYRWYEESVVCFAFLSDVTTLDDIAEEQSEFSESAWFCRGWTLQELLAPKEVIFVSASWDKLGTKAGLCRKLSRITSIGKAYLSGKKTLSSASLACRMSWASKRTTKRPEDKAYCLLGIFDVNMPLIYGEGLVKAFRRLQEEILNETTDESIFAWWQEDGPDSDPCGFLASTPADFARSADIVPWTHPALSSFELTRRAIGLRAVDNKVVLQCKDTAKLGRLLAIPYVASGEPGHWFRSSNAEPDEQQPDRILQAGLAYAMKRLPQSFTGPQDVRFDILLEETSRHIKFGRPKGKNYAWDSKRRTFRILDQRHDFVVRVPVYIPPDVEAGLWMVGKPGNKGLDLKLVALVPSWEAFLSVDGASKIHHLSGVSDLNNANIYVKARSFGEYPAFPLDIEFSAVIDNQEMFAPMLRGVVQRQAHGQAFSYTVFTEIEASSLKLFADLIAHLKREKDNRERLVEDKRKERETKRNTKWWKRHT